MCAVVAYRKWKRIFKYKNTVSQCVEKLKRGKVQRKVKKGKSDWLSTFKTSTSNNIRDISQKKSKVVNI